MHKSVILNHMLDFVCVFIKGLLVCVRRCASLGCKYVCVCVCVCEHAHIK